ncbi:MAG: UbiA family prenyltransferase, partial [Kofleriaceae bacterium]
ETAHLNREAKIAAILAHTKGQPFDYAGNEAADLPIWERARRSICVDTPASVVRVVRGYSGDVEELPRERELRLRTLAKAVRVHQWLKNFLLFVPIAAAHRVSDIKADAHVLIAFAAFSLCASSVYVLNDLTDLRADRLHPRKRKRPFAAGDLDLKTGMLMIPLLLGSSVALSLAFLPLPFFAVLVSYYVGSMAYNFAAKERVIWDVILLAGLYVLRVIAGAAAVPVPISFWLLAFSLFIFLSLALTKRYSEMSTMLKAGRSIATGRGYRTDDMPLIRSMGVVSGYLAVLVMALYINSPEIHALYARPGALWGICPLLLFWISRLWLKTHRGEMHDDPVVFAVRDPMSLAVGGLAAGCVAFGALAT